LRCRKVLNQFFGTLNVILKLQKAFSELGISTKKVVSENIVALIFSALGRFIEVPLRVSGTQRLTGHCGNVAIAARLL
jgi:hypothetical protein